MAKTYDKYLFENSDFLKSQYNNIFKDPNQSLHNLFTSFIKKLDTDNNISSLYQRYLKSNQTTVQTEINNAESVEDVNSILNDEIKYFYYSLKPMVDKLQDDEFTMEEIFDRSRDKNFKALMTYPEDKFANAVGEYVSNFSIPQIKEDSGLNKSETETEVNMESTVERVRYNINKIFEATDEEKITSYKKSAIKWLNTTLFEPLKQKVQILNQLGTNTSIVDDLANQMKNSNNEEAKKMIINKIINLDNQELQKLATSLGLSEEEIGKL